MIKITDLEMCERKGIMDRVAASKKETTRGRKGLPHPLPQFHTIHSILYTLVWLLLGPRFLAFWLRSSVAYSVGGFPVGVSVVCVHALAVLWCTQVRLLQAIDLCPIKHYRTA